MTTLQEKLDAFDRYTADTPLELSDGSFIQIPPNPAYWPQFLDDDQLEVWEQLQFEVEGYDCRDVHVPAEFDSDGNEISPATVLHNQLVKPFQKGGELVKPAHQVRMVKAAIGEDAYNRLRASGKNAADVLKVWGRQNAELLAASI